MWEKGYENELLEKVSEILTGGFDFHSDCSWH